MVKVPVISVAAATTPAMATVSTPAISAPAISAPAISTPAVSAPAISTPATTAPTTVSVGASGAVRAVRAVGPIYKGSSIVRKASNSEDGTLTFPQGNLAWHLA
ncbi:hypothetical protein AX14_007342 [Amanita brunnescens Koide BX004]|nr:hypothetical protein AX14_007342 [Amanita brunnescens Koide BX004]